jgi:hypothetical protein
MNPLSGAKSAATWEKQAPRAFGGEVPWRRPRNREGEAAEIG